MQVDVQYLKGKRFVDGEPVTVTVVASEQQPAHFFKE